MTKIIITNNSKKMNMLQKLAKEENISDQKILTIEEIHTVYPYEYDDKTLDYIVTKYQVILEIAKIILKTITTYPLEKLNDNKAKFLKEIKKDLIDNKLLTKNTTFQKYLQRNEVVIHLPKTKELEYLFREIPNITYVKEENNNYAPTIYELETIDKEIAFIAEKIANLIHQGVSPQHIFIANLDDDYTLPLIRIFKLMHIPLELENKVTLNQTFLGSEFLKYYKDNEQEALEKIFPYVQTEEEKKIYNQIISVINKYVHLKNKKMFITAALSHQKKDITPNKNAIHEINWLEYDFQENDYLFLLNCQANKIPETRKDEDFLSDNQKENMGFTTSYQQNKQQLEKTIAKIKNIPHSVMTLKKEINGKECFPSPILEEVGTKKKETTKPFHTSDEYNKLCLAKELDEYMKYNTITEDLILLENNYQIPYQTYQNEFQGIDKEAYKNHLNQTLTLSYTSLDTYIKCPFHYYLTYVLKILPYKETFALYIGNLFHKILEQAWQPNYDWQTKYEEEISKKEWTPKERFFLKKLKTDLAFVIQTIHDQMEYTSPHKVETEKEITLEKQTDIKIILKGKIDKLLTIEHNNQKVLVVIDYKTGSSIIKEEYIPLGFCLQLPIYLYLMEKEKENQVFGGIYFQNIIPSRIKYDPKYTYEFQRRKALKLNGYSTKDQSILALIDSSFKDSHIINSLKVKNDGEFYNYAKVLDEKDITLLKTTTESHLKDNTTKILNADFQIKFQIIDNKENISCPFCPFKDICYHSSKDTIYLQSNPMFLKKEEDTHGLDERTTTSH